MARINEAHHTRHEGEFYIYPETFTHRENGVRKPFAFFTSLPVGKVRGTRTRYILHEVEPLDEVLSWAKDLGLLNKKLGHMKDAVRNSICAVLDCEADEIRGMKVAVNRSITWEHLQ